MRTELATFVIATMVLTGCTSGVSSLATASVNTWSQQAEDARAQAKGRQYGASIRAYESAIAKLGSAQEAENAASMFLLYLELAEVQFASGDAPGGEVSATKAVEQGVAFLRQGDFQMARRVFELVQSRLSGSPYFSNLLASRCLLGLGLCLEKLGEIDQSTKILKQISGQRDAPGGLKVSANRILRRQAIGKGNYKEALEYDRKSLSIFECSKLVNKRELLEVLKVLTEDNVHLHDWKSAHAYGSRFRSAVSAFGMNDLEGEAIAYEAEGGMLLEQGRVGDAFIAYEQASKKYREKDPKSVRAAVLDKWLTENRLKIAGTTSDPTDLSMFAIPQTNNASTVMNSGSRANHSAQQVTWSKPMSTSFSHSYVTGDGHWIQNNSGGRIISLEDGSVWEVSAIDQVDSMLWLPVTNINVVDNASGGSYPYLLVNTDDGEKVEARLVSN